MSPAAVPAAPRPSIAAALSAVMADVLAVRKLDRNDQQGFNFRGVDAVVNAVGPALRKHGVIVLPRLLELTVGTVDVGVGDRRRSIGHVVVQVAYRFVGPAGDELELVVPGEAMDSGDKAIAKAMSVAFRIALLQGLALPTDEPDPDATSYERAPRPTQTEQAVGKVLDAARRAGLDEATAGEQIRARHDGRDVHALTLDELRAEWRHYHDQEQPA